MHYSEIQAQLPEFVAHFPQFLAEGFGEGLFEIPCHFEQVCHLGELVQHEHLGDLEQLGELGCQRLVEEEEVAVASQDFPPSIKILPQFLIFNFSSPCFFPPDLEDIVDKLLARPVLPVQTDVLDLGSKLTQLPASSASNASVRARSPVIVSPC